MRISDWSSDVCSSDLAHMRGLVVGKHVLALARRSERHRIIGQLGIGKHTIEPRMTARLPACLETMTGQRLQRVGASEPFEFARIERGATRKVVDIHECFLQARLHDAMPGLDIETTPETQTETDTRPPFATPLEIAGPTAGLPIDSPTFT